MATAWQDRFTPLANINNGNEIQNGDDILSEHINAAIENGAYAKKVTDQLTTLYTNLDGRVVTLENKKFYTHNIKITCTSASQALTNWNFVRFDAYFTIVSPSSLSFSDNPIWNSLIVSLSIPLSFKYFLASFPLSVFIINS